MLKPMNVRKLTRRHICSIKGCGNRDTVLVARSQDLYGGTYICRDCVAALADHFGITAEAEKESTGGNANEAPVNEEKATAPVTEPPVTEPPATEPPVTEPPATEPPATEPPATATATKASKSSSKKGDK